MTCTGNSTRKTGTNVVYIPGMKTLKVTVELALDEFELDFLGDETLEEALLDQFVKVKSGLLENIACAYITSIEEIS